MIYDRAAIMNTAWASVARMRKAGHRGTVHELLSRALSCAWWDAKVEMSARRAAAAAQAECEALEARSSADLEAAIVALENRNTLGHDGLERLGKLRAAYRAAIQREEAEREAEAFAAKRALIASAGGRFATVTFIKKDGSERVMRVQPAALKYHVVGEAASEAAKKAIETRAQRHPNLLPVWDAEKAATRSVNLATITRIAVNGAVHEFTIH